MMRALTTLILPDAHFPNQHKPSMKIAMRVIERVKPDTLGILGDWFDGANFSNHPKSASLELREHSYMQDEVAPIRKFLAEARRYVKKVWWVEGNHDAWFERLMVQKMPTAAADIVSHMGPRELLKDLVDTWVPYKSRSEIQHYSIAPNLWAVHGWTAAKNAARVHLNKARTFSVVYGHTHRAEFAEDTVEGTGETIMAWSPGCLCNYNMIYCDTGPLGWSRGMTLIYQSRRDPSDWQPYPIRIYLRGKNTYRATLEGGHQIIEKETP